MFLCSATWELTSFTHVQAAPPSPPIPAISHIRSLIHGHIHTLTPTAGQRHVELINKHTHAPCRSHTLLVTLRYHFSAATLTLPPPQCPATLLPAGLGALRHTAGRTLLLLSLATDFSSNCIQSQLRLCKGTWHLCTSPRPPSSSCTSLHPAGTMPGQGC